MTQDLGLGSLEWTEAVYRRYAIVCEADLAEGVTTLARLGLTPSSTTAKSHPRRPVPQGSGTVEGQLRDFGVRTLAVRCQKSLQRLVPGEGLEPPRASRPSGF